MVRQVTGSGSDKLTFAQLESVAEQGGFPASMAPLMAAIALAESSGVPTATNPTDNNGKQTSWGLWQISTGTHSEPNPNWADPVENAKLAYAKYKTQGLWAWGTYTSGKYKQFLPKNYVAPDPTLTWNPTGGEGIVGTQPTGNPQGSWSGALGNVYSDVTGGLLTIPKEIIALFGDLDQLAGKLYDSFKLFFQPSTYVRIGAGFFGVMFVIVGLVFLAREAKESA